jgi:hypothetical protein
MFLLIGWLSLRYNGWVIRHTRSRPDLIWLRDLAAMVQVSLVGFATGGAFLSLSYCDLLWHLVAISVILRRLAVHELAKPRAETEMSLVEQAAKRLGKTLSGPYGTATSQGPGYAGAAAGHGAPRAGSLDAPASKRKPR